MLLIDDRTGSKDLAGRLSAYIGAPPVELTTLEFGDVAFAGNGPTGDVTVGIEVKTVADTVDCIIGGRFAGHQLPGLTRTYNYPYLLVEGTFRSHQLTGALEVPFGKSWGAAFGSQTYAGYMGWLTTIEEQAGVRVRYTDTRRETGDMIMALYRWYQKKWEDHDALKVIYQPPPRETVHIGTKRTQPTQVERVAASIDGIGWKTATRIGQTFLTVKAMVEATDEQWREIDGVGKGLARNIMAALGTIRGQ